MKKTYFFDINAPRRRHLLSQRCFKWVDTHALVQIVIKRLTRRQFCSGEVIQQDGYRKAEEDGRGRGGASFRVWIREMTAGTPGSSMLARVLRRSDLNDLIIAGPDWGQGKRAQVGSWARWGLAASS